MKFQNFNFTKFPVNEEYLQDESSQDQDMPVEEIPINYEIHINSDDEDEIIPVVVNSRQKGEKVKEYSDESIRESMNEICSLAASQGVLEKIKSIDTSKNKDSIFISKLLELIFDKQTLASSSVQGQRCQRNLSGVPKPALDAEKLDLCKRAFIFRIRSDENSAQHQNDRLKNFLKFVNYDY